MLKFGAGMFEVKLSGIEETKISFFNDYFKLSFFI
jgi:hypothetical protein